MDKYMSYVLGVIVIFLIAFFLSWMTTDLGLTGFSDTVYMRAIPWLIILFLAVGVLVKGK